jgi:hypothetical protein
MRVSQLDFEVEALATFPIMIITKSVILLDLFSDKNCPLDGTCR